MSDPKDTLLRSLTLLQLIPRAPQYIATSTLQEKLKDRGFFISQRSIQRDLKDKLSLVLPLTFDEKERPYRWSFDRQAKIDLVAMDTPSSLALHLAESHLSNLLPQSVMDQLGPQFRAARNYLDGLEQNGLAHWARRVRALPNGKALLPAEITPQVWAQVCAALMERKVLLVDYLSRSSGTSKSLSIHPAGLVSRHSISYLIGTVNGYDDLLQFALHRIQKAELLAEPAREYPDFDIDRYIASGAFTWRQASDKVELIADVHPQMAWLLNETPLSPEQILTPLPESDWQQLVAKVPLDQETLWWIFGLNDNIRVHAPQVWVDEIKIKLEKMRGLYSSE